MKQRRGLWIGLSLFATAVLVLAGIYLFPARVGFHAATAPDRAGEAPARWADPDQPPRPLLKDASLESSYRQLPPEKLQEKVTLISQLRNQVRSDADFSFLKSVLSEPVCLSFKNCAEPAPESPEDRDHDEMDIEISLASPQLVALKVLELTARDARTETAIRERSWKMIEDAAQSENEAISGVAKAMLKKPTN